LTAVLPAGDAAALLGAGAALATVDGEALLGTDDGAPLGAALLPQAARASPAQPISSPCSNCLRLTGSI